MKTTKDIMIKLSDADEMSRQLIVIGELKSQSVAASFEGDKQRIRYIEKRIEKAQKEYLQFRASLGTMVTTA